MTVVFVFVVYYLTENWSINYSRLAKNYDKEKFPKVIVTLWKFGTFCDKFMKDQSSHGNFCSVLSSLFEETFVNSKFQKL